MQSSQCAERPNSTAISATSAIVFIGPPGDLRSRFLCRASVRAGFRHRQLGALKARKEVNTAVIEGSVVRKVKRLLSVFEGVGLLPPVGIALTLVGVDGYKVVRTGDNIHMLEAMNGGPIAWNGSRMYLPPVLLEDLDETSVSRRLRPLFDALSQAGGFPGSKSYDRDGNWVGHEID